MTVPRLIGLYSPAPRSGKSTVAAYLTEHGFYTVPFARPIKLMTRTFLMQLGYGPSDIDHFLTDGKNDVLDGIRTTPRHLMQVLGTEWGRGCVHPEVWLMCWERAAREKLDAGLSVVVDDCRFRNEATLIRRFGGELWRLERPGVERGTSHTSEGGLDDYPLFDRRLVNDGSLIDLYRQVQERLTFPTVAA